MAALPRWLRRSLLALALLAVVAGAASLAFAQWKAGVDRDLDAAWRRSLGGRSFLERYPKTGDNATVRELEELGASIGIDLAPAEVKGRSRPAPEQARRFAAVKTPLRDLLDPAAQPEDGTLAAPPPAVAQYLDFARPTLLRIIEVLRRDPPPIWERDLGRGFEAKIPNLLGVLQVQKLLVLEAREQLRNGRREPALGVLEASWRYNEAVRENGPSLIHQLIANAVVKLQQPVLRNLPAPSAASALWRSRLEGIDPVAHVLTGLHAEAFISHHVSTLDRPLGGQGGELANGVWMRLLIWDHARRFEAMVQELARRDVRSFDPAAFHREQEKRVPRWNLVSRILLPNFWDAWGKAARVELSADLTARILEERGRLATGAPQQAARRPSRVPGLSWIYEQTPEGTRIRLDGDLTYRELKPVPLRFLVRAAG